MSDRAFEFKCKRCGLVLKDGDDLLINASGIMSGNTPLIFTYEYLHKKCPNEETWITGFDCYD